MSKDDSLIEWLDDVADEDYTAAYNYLTLNVDEIRARNIVSRLQEVKLCHRRANDILRATKLPALSMNDPGVRHSLIKVLKGEKLSPILVSERSGDIADGYHRVSLAYNIDPFMTVPLRMG